MIIADFNTIKLLSRGLYEAAQKYLASEREEESLFADFCEALGRLIEAHLYFDPNFPTHILFHRFSDVQVEIADNCWQVNGLITWKYRYSYERWYTSVVTANILLPDLSASEQLAPSIQIDYRIVIVWQDIRRYITPQTLSYESCNSNQLPDPNIDYFIEMILAEDSYNSNNINIFEQLGPAGRVNLHQRLVQEPDIIANITGILEHVSAPDTDLLVYREFLLAALKSDDEDVKTSAVRIAREWSEINSFYRQFLTDQQLLKQFDIEDHWSYLSGTPPANFIPDDTKLSLIRDSLFRNPPAMARLIDCLDHHNVPALSLLADLQQHAAPAIDKLKSLLETAVPEYFQPANRWCAVKIFSILDRIKLPEAQVIIDQALNSSADIRECAQTGIAWNSSITALIEDVQVKEDQDEEKKRYYLEKFNAILNNEQSTLDDFSDLYQLSPFKDDPAVKLFYQAYLKLLMDKLVTASDADRIKILYALSSFGYQAQAAIPYLLEIFWQQPQPRFSEAELRLLEESNQDPTDESIIPQQRFTATHLLCSFAVATPAVIEALQAALTMRNINEGWSDCHEREICKMAACGLIRIGQFKILLTAVRNTDDADSIEAYFLACIKYIYDVDLVVDLLPEMSAPTIYYFGLQVLIGLRERAITALPRLIEWLKDEQVLYRPLVAAAIGAIGPTASEAIPILTPLLGHPDIVLSMKSAEALSGIGSAALPAIIAALDKTDQSDPVRETLAIKKDLDNVTICWLIQATGNFVIRYGKKLEIQQVLQQWQDHPDVNVSFLAEKVLNDR